MKPIKTCKLTRAASGNINSFSIYKFKILIFKINLYFINTVKNIKLYKISYSSSKGLD